MQVRIKYNLKKCSLLFVLCLGTLNVFNQSKSPVQGAYLNSVEFNKGRPFAISEFIFVVDNYEYKCDSGVNAFDGFSGTWPCESNQRYLVKTSNPKIKRKVLDKMVWGIYYQDSFYLNIGKLGMAKGYIKIDQLGMYSYFQGKPMATTAEIQKVGNATALFGMPGAIIKANSINNKIKDNIHYVLNLKIGTISLLNKEYVLRLLKPYDDLLYNFQIEKDNDLLETWKLYLELVNEHY